MKFLMRLLEERSIWLYFIIFFGKILEVAVSTVRMVLINKGERLKGSLIAVIEIILWITITGTVLNGFQEDIWRVVVFAAAFAIGNYLGSWMEDKLAFGLCSVQVIIPECQTGTEVIEELRKNKFAVTEVKGMGKDGHRDLLFLHIKRKKIPQAVNIVKEIMDSAVIVVNDSKVLHGGFIKK